MSMSVGSEVSHVLPRYLRVRNINSITEEQLENAKREIKGCEKMKWLANFLVLPADVSIAPLRDILLKNGLFPMDIASEIPVRALMSSFGEKRGPMKVLDLCCSPGGKLLSIYDKLGKGDIVDGVDINKLRIETCRALIRRNLSADLSRHGDRGRCDERTGRPTMRMFKCDGRVFPNPLRTPKATNIKTLADTHELVFESSIYHASPGVTSFGDEGGDGESDSHSNNDSQYQGRRRASNPTVNNKSGRKREGKRLRNLLHAIPLDDVSQLSLCEYDAVLVDAECTHDGSYRHMKYIESEDSASSNGNDGKRYYHKPSAGRRYRGDEAESDGGSSSSSSTSTGRSSSVHLLQRDLVAAGFRALRPGGVMVYSTCSLEKAQNEDVIAWLLQQEGSAAELVPMSSLLRPPLSSSSSSTPPSATGKAIDVLQYGSDEAVCITLGALDSASLSGVAREAVAAASSRAGPQGWPGSLPGTVRFDRRSLTSGLFLAKIRKRSPSTTESAKEE